MDDSIISFRNDESDREAYKLYRRVTKYLRKIVGENQIPPTEEDITPEVLFEVIIYNLDLRSAKFVQFRKDKVSY